MMYVCVGAEGPGGGNTRETAMLKKQNKQLVEENNLLKIKIELLLDMVSHKLFATMWSLYISPIIAKY
jgi:Chibby family